MVAVATHPDAAAEGAEGIAVVFAAVLLQELFVVHLRILELIAVVAIGQQGRGECSRAGFWRLYRGNFCKSP